MLLGSAGKAREMSAELVNLSAATHLSVDGLAKAAQTMLSFNVAGNEIVPMLKEIGDVSGGNAQRFESLALVFGETASAGHLLGHQLLQYIAAGFNPLQEIAAKTGKSMGELRKEAEAGNITFKQVQEAFRSATSEGGRFFGFTEANAKTAAGLFANLTNRVTTLFREFGTPVVDALKPMLEGAVAMTGSLKASAGEWGASVAKAMGALRGLFTQGQLGDALSLSLQIGFGEAVNYGSALLSALAEAVGAAIGGNIKSSLTLLKAATTKDFWAGMADALHAIALEFVALIERMLAGILETVGKAPGMGVLRGAAEDLRTEAKGDTAQAGMMAGCAGGSLAPLFAKFQANAEETLNEVGEIFQRNFSNVPEIVQVGDKITKLKGLLSDAVQAAVPGPEEKHGSRYHNVNQFFDDDDNHGKLGKQQSLSDRLSKVGLFVGGSGGPQGQKAAEETATNTRKLVEEMKNNTRQQELLQNDLRQSFGAFA